MPDFMTFKIDHDAMVQYGLRIVRDEVSALLDNPRNIELGTVQGLLAGLNVALNSVPVTPETGLIRDELKKVLDQIFPVVQHLNSEDWGDDVDNCVLCDAPNSEHTICDTCFDNRG